MSKRSYSIRKVVVLGSGTMGSQIAAHCVNAGLDVWLLDLKAGGDRPNKTAEENIKKLTKMNPSPLALTQYAGRIRPGNFQDDIEVLREADWICEAIVEKMDIKKRMMSTIEQYRCEGSIVSSNTSGLPIHKISEDCGGELKQHFIGTHFFNPPRYMKLLEIIPTADTSREVIEYMSRFCEKTLGKGVIQCKDTPNFIANRIGIFSMASIMPYFFDGTFRAEEIDFLTGTLTGYSKAATFRTADMSGLDVIGHVADNLYPAIPKDERRDVFKLPDRFQEMVSRGMHGNKVGEGFYKKVQTDEGKEYKVINPQSMEYESQVTPQFDSTSQARKKFRKSEERLRFIVQQDDKAGRFLWNIHCDLLLYAANRVPEITDSPEAVDRAMKWGFNWGLGPFERWDAIGVRASVERMQHEGREVPESVIQMLQSGRERFYDPDGKTIYNLATGEAETVNPPARGAVTVGMLRSQGAEVMGNESAGLYDMGDGVALFEFRTRQHTLGFELVSSLMEACEKVESDFEALVVGHDGDNFTYGANLLEAMEAWKKGRIEQVREAVKNFQDAAVGLRYQPFPVVVAPFGRTLGGGVEFMLHADKVVAHHELYAGLVEVGVGLLPAGGGIKEMVHRVMQRLAMDSQNDPVPGLREVFKTIGMAKVSDSAPRAQQLGYLRKSDAIVMNRDLLLAAAKEEARTMADVGYQPPAEPSIRVLGREGLSVLKMMLFNMHSAKYITDYDRVVGEKVAYVLSGGDLSESQEVPERYLLKLEREAFVELLEDERTRDRIRHMLETGKPLRN